MRITKIKKDYSEWPEITEIHYIRNNGREHFIGFSGLTLHTPFQKIRFGGSILTSCTCDKCIQRMYPNE